VRTAKPRTQRSSERGGSLRSANTRSPLSLLRFKPTTEADDETSLLEEEGMPQASPAPRAPAAVPRVAPRHQG